jgi:hypothetical protein
MLEPEIAALHDGAVDYLGDFVEPSLVLLRTRPMAVRCSVQRWNAIARLDYKSSSSVSRDIARWRMGDMSRYSSACDMRLMAGFDHHVYVFSCIECSA